jgi:hypothetical protein
MSAPLILTAEHIINPGRGAWVLLETWSFQSESGALIPSEFVIRTSTGYRAVLPACWRDECVAPSGPVRCVRKDCPESSRTHCHRTHIEHAEVFAAEVAATYRQPLRKTSLAGLLAHPKRVRNVGVKAWAENPYAMALEGR